MQPTFSLRRDLPVAPKYHTLTFVDAKIYPIQWFPVKSKYLLSGTELTLNYTGGDLMQDGYQLDLENRVAIVVEHQDKEKKPLFSNTLYNKSFEEFANEQTTLPVSIIITSREKALLSKIAETHVYFVFVNKANVGTILREEIITYTPLVQTFQFLKSQKKTFLFTDAKENNLLYIKASPFATFKISAWLGVSAKQDSLHAMYTRLFLMSEIYISDTQIPVRRDEWESLFARNSDVNEKYVKYCYESSSKMPSFLKGQFRQRLWEKGEIQKVASDIVDKIELMLIEQRQDETPFRPEQLEQQNIFTLSMFNAWAVKITGDTLWDVTTHDVFPSLFKEDNLSEVLGSAKLQKLLLSKITPENSFQNMVLFALLKIALRTNGVTIPVLLAHFIISLLYKMIIPVCSNSINKDFFKNWTNNTNEIKTALDKLTLSPEVQRWLRQELEADKRALNDFYVLDIVPLELGLTRFRNEKKKISDLRQDAIEITLKMDGSDYTSQPEQRTEADYIMSMYYLRNRFRVPDRKYNASPYSFPVHLEVDENNVEWWYCTGDISSDADRPQTGTDLGFLPKTKKLGSKSALTLNFPYVTTLKTGADGLHVDNIGHFYAIQKPSLDNPLPRFLLHVHTRLCHKNSSDYDEDESISVLTRAIPDIRVYMGPGNETIIFVTKKFETKLMMERMALISSVFDNAELKFEQYFGMTLGTLLSTTFLYYTPQEWECHLQKKTQQNNEEITLVFTKGVQYKNEFPISFPKDVKEIKVLDPCLVNLTDPKLDIVAIFKQPADKSVQLWFDNDPIGRQLFNFTQLEHASKIDTDGVLPLLTEISKAQPDPADIQKQILDILSQNQPESFSYITLKKSHAGTYIIQCAREGQQDIFFKIHVIVTEPKKDTPLPFSKNLKTLLDSENNDLLYNHPNNAPLSDIDRDLHLTCYEHLKKSASVYFGIFDGIYNRDSKEHVIYKKLMTDLNNYMEVVGYKPVDMEDTTLFVFNNLVNLHFTNVHQNSKKLISFSKRVHSIGRFLTQLATNMSYMERNYIKLSILVKKKNIFLRIQFKIMPSPKVMSSLTLLASEKANHLTIRTNIGHGDPVNVIWKNPKELHNKEGIDWKNMTVMMMGWTGLLGSNGFRKQFNVPGLANGLVQELPTLSKIAEIHHVSMDSIEGAERWVTTSKKIVDMSQQYGTFQPTTASKRESLFSLAVLLNFATRISVAFLHGDSESAKFITELTKELINYKKDKSKPEKKSVPRESLTDVNFFPETETLPETNPLIPVENPNPVPKITKRRNKVVLPTMEEDNSGQQQEPPAAEGTQELHDELSVLFIRYYSRDPYVVRI